MTRLRRPLPWQDAQWQAVSAALKQQRLAHALLLVGPRGIGKRHFTSILAQALLCRHPADDRLPCGRCQPCMLVDANTHPDHFRLERSEDSKVLKVDDLREFNRKVFLTPQLGQGSVGIIDPVDGLNRSSANALLKSLEEPPRGAHILLVGERWMGLPATLRSRCLLIRFDVPAPDTARAWLGLQPADAVEWEALRERFMPDTDAHRELAEGMAALCQGLQDPVELAARWQKPEENLPRLVDWLHGCVADLLKLKSQVPAEKLSNPQLVRPLQAMASQLSPQALSALAALNLETRFLLEKTQARPQMLLENLLASWYQGSRSPAHRPPEGQSV